MLSAPTEGIWLGEVRLGNRSYGYDYAKNSEVSQWKKVSINVENNAMTIQ
jgi:hypothetical protein